MKRAITYGVALVALTLPFLSASCGPTARRGGSGRSGGNGTSSGGSAAFTSQCRGDFGASATAGRFEALMLATYEFHTAATEAEATLLQTCQAMGRALEMDGAELQGDTQTVCNAVKNTLQTEFQAIGEGSETEVEIRSTPPRCEATFEAYADCAARCDVNIEPGQVEMNCTGGEIRGQCSASCTGRCAVDVQAQCSGTCEGSCEGTCSARAADGSCAGTCDGTCRGQCVAQASAECSGECRGECSVEWQRPYCTGTYEPPQVNADCRAACETHVEATMECTPGSTELIVTGGPDEETQARQARVREAVRVGIAQILTVRARVERLQRSGAAVLRQLEALPSAIREIGISAAACSAGALSDFRESMASVSVSVEVSVSVSASVNASGG